MSDHKSALNLIIQEHNLLIQIGCCVTAGLYAIILIYSTCVLGWIGGMILRVAAVRI